MSNVLGYVVAGAQIGLDSILIKPKRSIGSIVAQVTIEETHHDDLEITDHPVEQGAIISDHAYKRPAEVTIRCAWSSSPSAGSLVDGIAGAAKSTVSGVQSLVTGNSASSVRDVYAKLLKLQTDRIPFDVFTGKRAYNNMLVKSLTVVTDKEHEQSLLVVATLRQVIIVQTQTLSVAAPAANQADPAATQPQVNSGAKSLIPTSRYVPATTFPVPPGNVP